MLPIVKKRKAQSFEMSLVHNNEIGNWKAKVKELELDNMQLIEMISKREQELVKVIKEKDTIYNEMVTMRHLHMHLSNVVEDEENAYSASDQTNSNNNIKNVPRYAQKIKQSQMKIRAGNQKLLESKASTKNEESIGNQYIANKKVESHETQKPDQQALVRKELAGDQKLALKASIGNHAIKLLDSHENQKPDQQTRRKTIGDHQSVSADNEILNENQKEYDRNPDQQTLVIESKVNPIKDKKQDLNIKEVFNLQTSRISNKNSQLDNTTVDLVEASPSVAKKDKLMKNAKIQIEYASYVGEEKNPDIPAFKEKLI